MAPVECRDRLCSVCLTVVPFQVRAWACSGCKRHLHEGCAQEWHTRTKTCPTCRHGDGGRYVIDLTKEVIDLTGDEDAIDLTEDEYAIDLTEDEYAIDLTDDECVSLTFDDINLTLDDIDMEVDA
jgi:hypothetical protein